MSVTLKDVEHVAKLARLEFTAEEKEKLVRELNKILGYMDKLNELETTNIEPLSHVVELQNVFRDDVARPSPDVEEMLKNAPARKDSFFRVPKVIGDK